MYHSFDRCVLTSCVRALSSTNFTTDHANTHQAKEGFSLLTRLLSIPQACVNGYGACPGASQQRGAPARQCRQSPAYAAHIASLVSGCPRQHTAARSFSSPWPAAEAAASCALHQRLCQAASSPLAVSSEAPGGALSRVYCLSAASCSSFNAGRSSGACMLCIHDMDCMKAQASARPQG